jgi:restriction system protein
MSQRNEKFGDLLLRAPWWVSAGLGVLAYVGLRWILPAFAGQDKLVQTFFVGLSPLAPFAALVFGIMAVASALFGVKRRRLVDDQQSLETLRATSWKDFEYLVAEAYCRRGFTVDYSLGKGSDGGVDLVLRKNGRRSLVQCKQWKARSVGRPVLQQMFGIMIDKGADETIIVTSGGFNYGARAFARGKPIHLVDGPSLLELVTSVQAGRENVSKAEPDPAPAPVSPRCPRCGKEMILRTARRGSQAGRTFWGCPSFPACKGTLPA